MSSFILLIINSILYYSLTQNNLDEENDEMPYFCTYGEENNKEICKLIINEIEEIFAKKKENEPLFAYFRDEAEMNEVVIDINKRVAHQITIPNLKSIK